MPKLICTSVKMYIMKVFSDEIVKYRSFRERFFMVNESELEKVSRLAYRLPIKAGKIIVSLPRCNCW